MMPWKQAYEYAMKRGVSPEEWRKRINWCLEYGHVISTPKEFLAFHDAEHNGEPAYFVAIALGGTGNVLGRFMRYACEKKKWVLWCRNNEERVRVFAWDKLARKAGIQ